MIIAEIIGGLGNQLFEYAAAKALAVHHNVPLKLDVSFYEKSKRSFMLDKFNCAVETVSANVIFPPKEETIVDKVYRRLLPPHKRVPFREPYFHYYPQFLKAPSHTLLKGFWQSEKYFASITDIIRNEFLAKPALVSHLSEKAKEMKQQSSISVHIRRGDYLNPAVIKHLGLASLAEDYFAEAISVIMKRHPDSKVYFFSDDIKWVKEFITQKTSISYPYEFISDTITKTDLEDFYLMQQCQHNIIANSTFSWWGAWLNNHPDKIVVAPKNWYHSARVNDKDLIPAKWLRL